MLHLLAPLGLALDAAARDELRRRYDAARDAETRTRFQMALLAGAGPRRRGGQRSGWG
jgi:hypothetical protein